MALPDGSGILIFSLREESGDTNLPSTGNEKNLRREKKNRTPEKRDDGDLTAFPKAEQQI